MRLPLSLTLLLLAAAAPLRVQAETPAEHYHDRIRPLLEKYCLDCHDGPKPKGDLDLGRFDALPTLWRDPKAWEKVLVQLHDRVMPPARKTQPSDAERAELAGWVGETLQHPDPAQLPRDPGPPLVRRLSRLEYDATVRDLLGTSARPGETFPPDGGGGAGFDNNASTLFLPPLLLEKYLAAAEAVLASAKRELLFPVPPVAGQSEAETARANLAALASRAFRRPAPPEVVERLLGVYAASRARGEEYETAYRLAAKAILISPRFLFRTEIEPVAGPEPQPIDDYDLASRLSFFLWSSMPDQQLLALSGEGKLHEPAVLEREVRRLLADPKARTFAEAFAAQWLRTKELRTAVAPAPDKFPEFTPELRDAFYEEPIAFFRALLQENGPLTDFLDCRYTFANEPLAKFYGVPGITGREMRRVELAERHRGGLLGMGGVLALTSYPRRTSPVLRGKWVMEEILGTPPPPPPNDVNTQAVDDRGKAKTFRARLEQHRADPKCAGCHARMDPLGFGLENFDPIGRWRTEAEKEPVDASGQLVDGAKFDGPVELKTLLLARQDEFTRNVAEKMLAYALGRGLEPADWWPVQQIAHAVAADGYRTQTLILEIARSYPFQYRRGATAPAVARLP